MFNLCWNFIFLACLERHVFTENKQIRGKIWGSPNNKWQEDKSALLFINLTECVSISSLVQCKVTNMRHSAGHKTLIPMKCSRFIDSSESLCEMRWPCILLSDRLDLTAPITAYVEAFFTLRHGSVWSFLFVPPCYLPPSPFNSWSHFYASSWISNAYLWRLLMSAAFPDSMTDTPPPHLPNNHLPSPYSSCPPPW